MIEKRVKTSFLGKISHARSPLLFRLKGFYRTQKNLPPGTTIWGVRLGRERNAFDRLHRNLRCCRVV